MGNSPDYWKRVPTTAEAIFGIELPYRPPKGRVAAFLWRQRLLLECTFGLSVLEPWEKVLTLVILYALLTLVATGVYRFTPHHVPELYRRVLYYLFGHEGRDAAAASVRGAVTGWVGRNASALGIAR